MKLVSHISYKLQVQHSGLRLACIQQNNLSSLNRAIATRASDQNAFHSAANFVFYGNTYLYAKHTSPTRDKGQQHHEKHSKLWSRPWCLFLYIYSIHSAAQRLQVLCWVLKHKQARHGLPKLPEGRASSVHCAETESQHRSKTDPWMAPYVVCRTCRCWTRTVLSIQFCKQYLFFLCRSRLKHDRHFIRK